ncbi:phage antirepressor N-terminal domain-containing protein [Rhodococcoides fascians]|uniref:phage antirepressor N-terminal domain-containing protein n=1 Tax=Rhodococcoides fascians TaxID=1828 RepID=UPI00068A40F9|nr:phage antirepressor N-terminal domain-containing protein [Rhodococcus fascians]
MTNSTQLVTIPVDGTAGIAATLVDGKPIAAFKPVVEMLGMAYSAQLQKLKGKSWAVVSKFDTTGADGKTYEMVGVDRKTLTMYLATLDESRVKEEFRPTLVALQREAAEALDSYFHDGGAINPNASESQLDTLATKVQQNMRVLALAKGLVDDNWLETKVRHQVAVALGEEPEIDPLKRTLTVSDYLDGKGVNAAGQRKFAGSMGALVKKQYRELHDKEPGKAVRFVNGADREVAAYAERDRALFDRAWGVFGSAIEPQYFTGEVAA